MVIRSLLAVAALMALTGCTAAETARTFNYGNPGRITCYAGNEVVFDDFSTGKVEKHGESDGFYFVSTTTNRLTEVSGMCVVDYGVQPSSGFRPVRR